MVSQRARDRRSDRYEREIKRGDAWRSENQRQRPLVKTAQPTRFKKSLYTPTEMEQYHRSRNYGAKPRDARGIVERNTVATRRTRQYRPKAKPDLLKYIDRMLTR